MKGRSSPGSCAPLSCEVCCKEIPQSEALNAEAADYIYHFCGPECFARFKLAPVPERGAIAMFQVRMQCKAAQEIGCGSRAKPVLQDLERLPGIGEAWLNLAGNLIAIVRTGTGSGAEGLDPALAVFRKYRVAVEALRGERFAKALDDFASRSGWYRGADVDRLSDEEARVIAARLVARLRARAMLPGPLAEALELAVAEACAHELIKSTQSPAARKRRLASAALAAARERLEGPTYAAFAKAVRLGHRPLPGER
jgi:hypothetical protein